MEACHDPDPNPHNCSLGNLRWDTRKNNHADKIKHGTAQRGDNHGKSRLRESDIPVIRRRLSSGETLKSVASDYGVCVSTIMQVKANKTWSHVQ